MKFKVYNIKDTLVGFTRAMMVYENDNIALRAFKGLVNDDVPNDVSKNPKDYQMFYLGEMDTDTGEFISDVKFLVNAIDLKEKVRDGVQESI